MFLNNFIGDKLATYPNVRQFVKFCVVGGTSAIINFAIYYSLTAGFSVWYVYSSVYSFVISAAFNFIANKTWTFRNRDGGRKILSQATKFFLVVSTGLVINTGIIYTLTECAGMDYRLSWVFASGMVTFWNYGFNRFWTFKPSKSPISDLDLKKTKSYN